MSLKVEEAIALLKELIQTPSFSTEEDGTAAVIKEWLEGKGVRTYRSRNNIWAKNKYFDTGKPTILLNSHHDTVHPNKGYTRDPFEATVEGGKLFGLGSNDAGGALVCLLSTFVHFYEREDMAYNIIVAATGEEENSGEYGLKELIGELPPIDFAIVGEPTQMHLAVAEKGLLVIDGYAPGKSGHAAHENTENAIYNAIEDIQWIRNFNFAKVSNVLGKVKMSVCQIDAGKQHNVVPASAHFVIDVRVNEHYTNEEVFQKINEHTKSRLEARSFRLNSSAIPVGHPIVQAGVKLGRTTYGSPTLSDQAVLSCPSLKIGPGDTLRSHQADEFIYLRELKEGIDIYVGMLEGVLY